MLIIFSVLQRLRDQRVDIMKDQNGNNTLSLRGKWYLNRNWRFLLFNAAFVIAFFGPLRDLVLTSWQSGYSTYIPFIPFISAYLLYENRQTIFSQKESSSVAGYFVIGIGILLLFVAGNRKDLLGHNDYLALFTFSMVMIWIGGFTFFYGIKVSRSAVFPLLFLFFAVPIPNAALERTILILQTGSAEISYRLLQASGMPIARDGFFFHLPTIDIEIAPQCSGIRSSLSLVITGVLAAYFFLRTGWARAVLMITIVPIAILKNGMRIFALSTLGVYVDKRILDSDLHKKGGFIFFVLALVFVGGVIVLLRKMENRKPAAPEKQ